MLRGEGARAGEDIQNGREVARRVAFFGIGCGPDFPDMAGPERGAVVFVSCAEVGIEFRTFYAGFPGAFDALDGALRRDAAIGDEGGRYGASGGRGVGKREGA